LTVHFPSRTVCSTLISEVCHKKNYLPTGLARRATGDLNTLARRIFPLAPGYRTALLSRPDLAQHQTNTSHVILTKLVVT